MTDYKALAHEIWTAAQLTPDEVVEDGVTRIEVLLRRAAHPAVIHCGNCGCSWLDDGLNPIGCPYCKQIDWGTINVELLPLPEGEVSSFGNYEVYESEFVTSYARANVVRAVAPLQAEIKKLREVLKALMPFIPSKNTYRNLGLDPKAPMEVLERARSLLSKGNSEG